MNLRTQFRVMVPLHASDLLQDTASSNGRVNRRSRGTHILLLFFVRANVNQDPARSAYRQSLGSGTAEAYNHDHGEVLGRQETTSH